MVCERCWRRLVPGEIVVWPSAGLMRRLRVAVGVCPMPIWPRPKLWRCLRVTAKDLSNCCSRHWPRPRRYLLRFEPFAEAIDLPRGEREAALRTWLARYADRLGGVCRAHPYNWFNFYDFWGEEQ